MFNNSDLNKIFDAINIINTNNNSILNNVNDIYSYISNSVYKKDIKKISSLVNSTSPTIINISETEAKFIRFIYFEINSFKLNNSLINSSIDFVCNNFNYSIYFYFNNNNVNTIYNMIICANSSPIIGNKHNTFIASSNENLIIKNNNPFIRININLIPTSNSIINVIYEILY
jgi:hypothetical protein